MFLDILPVPKELAFHNKTNLSYYGGASIKKIMEDIKKDVDKIDKEEKHKVQVEYQRVKMPLKLKSNRTLYKLFKMRSRVSSTTLNWYRESFGKSGTHLSDGFTSSNFGISLAFSFRLR